MSQSLFSVALVTSLTLGAGAASADTFTVDGGHSSATFAVKHLNVSHAKGRFNDVSGTIATDDTNVAATKIDVTIQTASVDSNLEKRDQHLRGPDFFDAKQFPTMTFKSDKVAARKDGALDVQGTLTIHGVSKPVTVVVKKIGQGKDPWGGTRVGYATSFTIKRSDYGMKFMLDGVSDDVTIDVDLEAVKK